MPTESHLMSSIETPECFLHKLRNIGDSSKVVSPAESTFVRVLDVRALTSRGTVFRVRY